ncbi:MAG TPA: hypothetical protein VGL42_05405 [Opitutaceae bacterium]|jgi:hypothetical protein
MESALVTVLVLLVVCPALSRWSGERIRGIDRRREEYRRRRGFLG